MSVEAQQETRGFQTEVTQLMELVAKSLYSNSEVFLRELVSNASDASDRLRREALSQESLYEGDGELKVQISIDKEKNTLTIQDNGIGMSREEIIEHLGTIAKSGTRAFKALLDKKDQDDSELIGQFGVGFYSAFVVADKVIVYSRRAGAPVVEGVEWESEGKGEYTVKNVERKVRGTEIILFLKESAKDFLEDMRLKTTIRKYSDHIALPIYVGEEQVNTAKALWTCSKSELGSASEQEEKYTEFYKHISHDFEPPLAWTHNKVEGGKLSYTSLLYIPSRAPFDLWMREHRKGLKLYVKRVFIMDNAQDFVPTYLRFIHGIIDSSDLPLNISRELLQSNKDIELMRAACVKRVLGMLEKMAKEDPEKYTKFWSTFGEVLKEGPAEDFANKERIAHLLRFASTHTEGAEQNSSLEQYVGRMLPEQKAIYYLIADNYIAAKSSPLLEVFKKKGIEVLLLSDRVDEWLVSSLQEFSGKPLQSIAKGDLDLGALEDKESKAQQEDQEKDFSALIEQVQEQLAGRVKSVRLTHRLTNSPACVVFDEQDVSGHMQRILKASGQEIEANMPILELNPEHVLLQRLKLELDAERIKPWSNIFLSQALLAEGEPLKDPAEFIQNLNVLLSEV